MARFAFAFFDISHFLIDTRLANIYSNCTKRRRGRGPGACNSKKPPLNREGCRDEDDEDPAAWSDNCIGCLEPARALRPQSAVHAKQYFRDRNRSLGNARPGSRRYGYQRGNERRPNHQNRRWRRLPGGRFGDGLLQGHHCRCRFQDTFAAPYRFGQRPDQAHRRPTGSRRRADHSDGGGRRLAGGNGDGHALQCEDQPRLRAASAEPVRPRLEQHHQRDRWRAELERVRGERRSRHCQQLHQRWNFGQRHGQQPEHGQRILG